MSLKAAFAAVLRTTRATRGLSQKNLAEVSSRTYISKLERGQCSPTLEMITALSRPLSLSPLTLVALTMGSARELSIKSIVGRLEDELEELHDAGVLEKLQLKFEVNPPLSQKPAIAKMKHPTNPINQAELCFRD